MKHEYQNNILYSEVVLPDFIFKKLKECVNNPENNKSFNNNRLAGNIKEEYSILKIDRDVEDFFEKSALEFYKKSVSYEIDKEITSKIDGFLWINKQKKYEFNPLHNHTGAISFVCWIQIPYNLEDELNLDNCKESNMPSNSLFEFLYSDIFGNLVRKQILIDKNFEGRCIFFNSRLNHQVNPFYTSDDYRISISGNINLLKKSKQKVFYK